jgi:preprotein translocase subunit SecA
MLGLVKKIVGSKNERELKRIKPMIQKINDLEAEVRGLGDEQLRGKTFDFKNRLSQGEPLEQVLPEAFPKNSGRASLRCSIDRWHRPP